MATVKDKKTKVVKKAPAKRAPRIKKNPEAMPAVLVTEDQNNIGLFTAMTAAAFALAIAIYALYGYLNIAKPPEIPLMIVGQNIPSAGTTRGTDIGYGFGYSAENVSAENCIGDQCLLINGIKYPAGSLNTTASGALDKALKNARDGYYFYKGASVKFNDPKFLIMMRVKEQQITMIESLYDKYGIKVSAMSAPSVSLSDSAADACGRAADAEKAAAALYDSEITPLVSNFSDMKTAFSAIRNASEKKYEPVFRECALTVTP